MSLSNGAVTRSTIGRNDVVQDSRRKSNHHRALDDSLFKIVDIHTISTIESRDICLVGITSTGCRLYFGISYNRSHHDQGRSILPLQHVRIPPTFDSVPAGALGASGQYQIHQSLYHNGIFLAAHAFNDAADALIASAPDSGPINKESTETQVPTYQSSFVLRNARPLKLS